MSIDLNDSAKERVGGVEARRHRRVDSVIDGMAREGWRVVHMAAGFGNWIYILFERG